MRYIIIFLFILFFAIASLAFENASKITWTANTDADISYYKVYQREQGQKNWIVISYCVRHPVTVFWTEGGVPGKCYEFAVTAVDTAGNESELSAISSKCFPPLNRCRGDVNNDGDVDSIDLSIFTENFGRINCFE